MKTYREHGCGKHHRSVPTFLRCAIPRAAWISGSGEFAVIVWCGTPTVSLYLAREEALDAHRQLDEFGCGAHCTSRHALVWVEVT